MTAPDTRDVHEINLDSSLSEVDYSTQYTYSLDTSTNYNFANASVITGVTTTPWVTSTSISPTWANSTTGKLRLEGENADIEINGKSLIDMLKGIEERLNILTVNSELETEWEELRALGNQYRALEQHILDKQATWDKLKAMPPPEID